MEDRYYVYAFLDPEKPGIFNYGVYKFDYEPFYIGKGTKDRLLSSKSLTRGTTFKNSKLINLKNKGLEPIIIKIIDNISDKLSRELEVRLIKMIGRRDMKQGPLVNLTNGGDGRLSSTPSDETKKKLKIINTINAKIRKELGTDKHTPETKEHLRKVNQGPNNPMYGKHHTEEIKEQHSLRVSGVNHPMFGKKHDQETISKIKENRNKSVNQEELNKISAERNSKSVLQYGLDNTFIAEYESIKMASQSTGISESVIGKNCRGVIKNPKRFIFKFKDLSSNILNNSYKVKIGDIWESYKLIKRNKQSAIVEKDGDIITLRRKDFPIFFEKNVI